VRGERREHMGAEDVSGLSAEDAVTLDAVLDEPMARAVLCASTEGRAWAMRQYRCVAQRMFGRLSRCCAQCC
jgi:hypothetical protein